MIQYIVAAALAALAFPGLCASQAGIRFSGETIRVEHGTLYFEKAGRGPAVIFIHGGQMDRRMWEYQAEPVTKEYTMIRYDVRGYGKSSLPSAPYSNVGDLVALMEHLRLRSATLVGLSLGGIIATDFALTYPGMVDGLVLAGPGLSGYQESAETNAGLWKIIEAARDSGYAKAGELWMKDPYMIPAMENEKCRSLLRRIVMDNAHCWLNNPMVERGVKPPAIERLSDIKAPTLVLVGDRDVPDIQRIVDTLSLRVPKIQKVVIRGSGHIISMERPEEFNEKLISFLRELYKK